MSFCARSGARSGRWISLSSSPATGRRRRRCGAWRGGSASLDKVQFLGRLPDEDLPDAYRAADVYVNAGVLELQSICGLEAIASGLPVVLADALALPELVDAAVPNGLLFTPGDEGELAAHLVRLFGDPSLRRTMGERSLAHSEQHSIDSVCGRFVELYREVIGIVRTGD